MGSVAVFIAVHVFRALFIKKAATLTFHGYVDKPHSHETIQVTLPLDIYIVEEIQSREDGIVIRFNKC